MATPIVSIIIIVIAILARFIQILYFYSIRFDGSYQVIAMQNFLKGKGISISEVLTSDLSTTLYQPLINWPPGYSFLLAPFYALSGNNYITAGILLETLAAVTLIFSCRSILKLLGTPKHFINLFTLCTGFFIYYFYFISSSDSIAISLFFFSPTNGTFNC